jgi:uncharacterized membrane protein YhaH (DUF805 family)
MFKAPFSFEGRITRTEFIVTGVVLCFVGALGAVFMDMRGGGEALGGIIMIAACWFGLAQGWKRSHDAGWTGMIALIPYINLLVLMFSSGDEGTNKYGPNPRNPAVPPSAPRPPASVPPLPEAWERARQSEEPKIRTISFKCGACGAQNANVEYQGTACCQFCGAPKG